MKKFKDIIFEEGIVVHCDTEEKAKALLAYADSKGYKWKDETSYLEDTEWSLFREGTCYGLKRGYFSNLSHYTNKKFKILKYEDVLLKETPQEEPKQVFNTQAENLKDIYWYLLGKTEQAELSSDKCVFNKDYLDALREAISMLQNKDTNEK